MPIEITLTTEQEVRLHAVPKTASGRALPDPVTFAVVSGAATLQQVDGDTQAIIIVASDAAGDTVISATDGAVSDTATVHVTEPGVATIELTADAPEPK